MSPETSAQLDIRQTAPLNSWVAISADETRIIAVGKSFGEVSAMCDAAGAPADVTILKTPPSWGPMAF
jgi:hypothetical protein